MRRFMLILTIGLIATGLACNFSSAATPTVEPTDTPEPPPPTSTPVPTFTPMPSPEPEWGDICVIAYADTNQNAMFDGGEPPLPGIQFSLHKGSMEIKSHLTTDSTELFCFQELPAGRYEVRAAAPENWQATNPTTLSLELVPKGRLPVVLGFIELTSLSVSKMMMADGEPALAIIAGRPDILTFYLVSVEALQRTDNGGRDWSIVGARPPARNVVMSPANPDLLIAGDGLDCFRGGPDAPMSLSNDGGASWTEATAGLNLKPLAWHPTDPAQGWAAGCDGLYRTTDTGDSWEHLPADLWGLFSLASVQTNPNSPDLLYASANSEGGSGTILRSEDSGQTWQKLVEELELWVSALLVNPNDPNELWFTSPAGVWHSPDGGANWSQSTAGLENIVVGDDYEFEGKGLHALALDDAGTLYLGTQQGLFSSSDKGTNWQRVKTTQEERPIHELIISQNGDLWMVAPGGVFTVSMDS